MDTQTPRRIHFLSPEFLSSVFLAILICYRNSNKLQQALRQFISLHDPPRLANNTFIQGGIKIFRFFIDILVEIYTINPLIDAHRLIRDQAAELISLRERISRIPDEKDELIFVRGLCKQLESEIKIARMREESLTTLLKRKDQKLEEAYRFPSVDYAMHLEKVNALKKKIEELVKELKNSLQSGETEGFDMEVEFPAHPRPEEHLLTAPKMFLTNDQISHLKLKNRNLEEKLKKLEMEKKIIDKGKDHLQDTVNGLMWELEITKQRIRRLSATPRKRLRTIQEEGTIMDKNSPIKENPASKNETSSKARTPLRRESSSEGEGADLLGETGTEKGLVKATEKVGEVVNKVESLDVGI